MKFINLYIFTPAIEHWYPGQKLTENDLVLIIYSADFSGDKEGNSMALTPVGYVLNGKAFEGELKKP